MSNQKYKENDFFNSTCQRAWSILFYLETLAWVILFVENDGEQGSCFEEKKIPALLEV